MNKTTRKEFHKKGEWCLGVIALLAVLAMPGLVLADGDGCNDGGGGGADIHTLSASFDGTSEIITVEMELCADADTKTKYRVHFDHTAPFAPDSDRDGDMVVDAADSCITTSDDGMHHGKKDTGPGTIEVDGATLTYTVEMSELSSNLVIGDPILVWADTQDKGIIDRAPNTDGSDGCAKPQIAGEYIELLLSDEILYAIGDEGPAGGIVFYVTDGGLHGLEAAPEDQSTGVQWGCFEIILGADETEVGKGAKNTLDILNGCVVDRPIAASVAAAYTLNGFDDWFLPSKDGLGWMYTNLHSSDLGDFASAFYWSSSEVDSDGAWGQVFNGGYQFIFGKNGTLGVRAVRAF